MPHTKCFAATGHGHLWSHWVNHEFFCIPWILESNVKLSVCLPKLGQNWVVQQLDGPKILHADMKDWQSHTANNVCCMQYVRKAKKGKKYLQYGDVKKRITKWIGYLWMINGAEDWYQAICFFHSQKSTFSWRFWILMLKLRIMEWT